MPPIRWLPRKGVIAELGHEIITVRIDRQHLIPKSVDCDAMIMLGGPYPLTMDNRPDWIANEQELVRKYVDKGRRILGICLERKFSRPRLGHQLAAMHKRNSVGIRFDALRGHPHG